MKKFVEILSCNIDENQEQLLAMIYNSFRKKVADTLVMLDRNYNLENNSLLAAIIGMAKESLIRMLGELKDEPILEIESGRIRITNYSRLENKHN